MSSGFYRAFEDKFRGERRLIKSRLKVYLPFIEPLKNIYSDAYAVDLGCGRGEWLELLRENGFLGQGVDLDDGMLAACRDFGLHVQAGDALSFLKKIPNESQVVISGFHLVEHIPFVDFQALVEESFRVLKPAGVLILETPNPENIVIGASSFYVDPTHQRPIPPELLAFLPEYYGFKKVKILRLQESPDLINKENMSLLDVLRGVSPDCSVVAQKPADSGLTDLTNNAFDVEYGVTLEELVAIYDHRMHKAEAMVSEVRKTVYDSRSWRITVPLRWFSLQLRLLKQYGVTTRAISLINKVACLAIRRSVEFIVTLPNLYRRCVKLVKRFGLYSYLRRAGGSFIHRHKMNASPLLAEQLSPHARKIYANLKVVVMNKREKEGG